MEGANAQTSGGKRLTKGFYLLFSRRSKGGKSIGLAIGCWGQAIGVVSLGESGRFVAPRSDGTHRTDGAYVMQRASAMNRKLLTANW